MILTHRDRLHWDYYLTLERDLLECRRYVEFHDTNMKTYSTEFLQLFLLACSEIDILSQRICEIINPNSKPRNMEGYKSIIEPLLHLSTFEVNSLYNQSPIKPFQEWRYQDHPQWWGDHNAVKHDRYHCYENANLQNTLWSLAGLYVLNIYYYYNYLREAELRPQSNLFRPNVKVERASTIMTYGYRLPHGDNLYPT